MFFICNAQTTYNKFRVFVGAGNNNLVSDIVSLTDKSYLGEVSGQLRGGVRFYKNYEVNLGAYFRTYPQADKYPGLTFNKFLGYSAAVVYEFRNPGSPWGLPFGFEVLKHSRHLDSALNDGKGTVYFDHYDAVGFGPKIGARYHISKYFFLETELEFLYEHYKWEVDWVEKSSKNENTFSSLKFFGISANVSF